jgi:Tfp pilus assembly protein PilF
MTKKKIVEAPVDFFAAHQQEITAHPTSPVAFVDKGWSHYSRHELDQAMEAFEQAATLDRQSIDAQYGLGMAARAKGDKARARQAFEKALALAETSLDVAKATMMRRMTHSALKGLEE